MCWTKKEFSRTTAYYRKSLKYTAKGNIGTDSGSETRPGYKSIHSMSRSREERDKKKRSLQAFYISAKNSGFEWNSGATELAKGLCDAHSQRKQHCLFRQKLQQSIMCRRNGDEIIAVAKFQFTLLSITKMKNHIMKDEKSPLGQESII